MSARRGLLAVSILVAATAPADAAVKCVNKTGAGGCSTSIQAAVNAAASGDTVAVAAGVYYENVEVNTSGISIVGADRLLTILDASSHAASGTTLTGPALRVNQPGVTVRNFTIRNGETNAVEISASTVKVVAMRFVATGGIVAASGPTGLQITSNEFRSVSGDAVSLLGNDDAVVKANRLTMCGGDCIDVQGARAIVSGNVVAQAGGSCVRVVGDEGAVTSNTCTAADSYGIEVQGANATIAYNRSHLTLGGVHATGAGGLNVHHNTATHSEGDGIYVVSPASGGSNTASNNTVTNAEGYGVYVQGGTGATANANRVSVTGEGGIYVYAHDPSVYTPGEASSNVVSGTGFNGIYVDTSTGKAVRNVVSDARDYGLESYCSTECAAGPLEYNQVTNVSGDGYGIYVGGNSPGRTVRANVITRAMGVGINVGIEGATLTGNRVTDSGSAVDTPCIWVEAGAATVVANQAVRCANSGIMLTSGDDPSTLRDNVVTGAFGNGIEVRGTVTGNTIEDNLATGNAGAGIAIFMGANTLTGNVTSRNRVGLCDQTGATIAVSNSFPDGTTTTCDIDR